MTFHRGKMPKTISFTCDECSSEFLETEEFDLRAASQVLRDAGWAVAQVDGEYEHHCPGCAKKLGSD